MVRYSKLPFRLLLTRHYNVDIAYTPMILAHEFIRSSIARDSDFTTNVLERQDGHVSLPGGSRVRRKRALVAQFASSDPEEFARAAELIAPWVRVPPPPFPSLVLLRHDVGVPTLNSAFPTPHRSTASTSTAAVPNPGPSKTASAAR